MFYRKGGIVRKCDACGKTYVESKDVFCPYCGAIAQKQCAHGSSFDSSKWDRGEIYKSGSNTYQYGAEPHAQRVGDSYNNQSNKSRQVKKQYGEDYKTPKSTIATILEALTKSANANKNDEKKVVKIIGSVIAAIAIFNVFISAVSEINSTNNIVDGFYEDVTLDYVDDVGAYPVDVVAGEVYIEPLEDWDGTWCFDMYLKTLYMSSFESELSSEVCDKLSGDDYIYLDGVFCVMSDKIMSLDNYNSVIDEECSYIISDSQSTDAHTVQYWFTDGDIVYFDWVRINFNDGTTVKMELPFDAFSCDEEGNVVYYTCNINEEEGKVTFEETEPVAVVDEFECMVEF